MFKIAASAVGLHALEKSNTRDKIWTCAEKCLKLLPLPIGLRERELLNYLSKINFGGLKGIQTLTRSLQDFYAVGLHHQPGKNWLSKAGFTPARVSFSQSFQHQKTLRVSSASATSTWKINTDGEIRTHIKLFLKQSPPHLGYVGAKIINWKDWSGRLDSNQRTQVSKTCPYNHLRNAQKK